MGMTAGSRSNQGLLSPLRHRDFRVFWIGLILSSVGSQFTQVAMAWQIYELTNSPLQIGLIGLVRAMPQMIILLFGGGLAMGWLITARIRRLPAAAYRNCAPARGLST